MQAEKATLDPVQIGRKRRIEALAHATLEELQAFLAALPEQPEAATIRGPETGLVMMRGRMGGTGSVFNLGEATMTRATVKLSSGEVGHGQRLGGDREATRLSAVVDALGCKDTFSSAITGFIDQIETRLKLDDETLKEETAATRVNFLTMVRGDD